MIVIKAEVEGIKKLTEFIHLIKVYSPEIASIIKPGQFCNIKVSDTGFPLLRRPFSVCDVDGDYIFFMFDIHGEGTRLLAKKNKGDELDILGPLGHGFNYDDDFDKAVIVAGGLGIAPFPYLVRELGDREVVSLIGGRNKFYVTEYGLKNVQFATDDGSQGRQGTVVDLLGDNLGLFESKCKVFSCGPTPMLKALQVLCNEKNIECEIATECAMACGFGICQGCPVEPADGGAYKLVCKDGPVFNARDIML